MAKGGGGGGLGKPSVARGAKEAICGWGAREAICG